MIHSYQCQPAEVHLKLSLFNINTSINRRLMVLMFSWKISSYLFGVPLPIDYNDLDDEDDCSYLLKQFFIGELLRF